VESLSWFETWPAFGLDGIATDDFSSHETTSTYRHESAFKRSVSGIIWKPHQSTGHPTRGRTLQHLGQQTARGAAFMSCAL
jgi:hypothetical protein